MVVDRLILNAESPRILSWLRSGGISILDQGFFASATLLINILLARWLPPSEYGAFAVAYSVFLFLGAFHTSALSEPMLVLGSGKYAREFPAYLGFVLRSHVVLAVATSLLLIAAALILRSFSFPLSNALIGLAIASPFLLLLWLLRRASYVRSDQHLAAKGSILHFFLVLAGAYVIHRLDQLTPLSAVIVLGIAALFPGLWLGVLFQPQLRPSTTVFSYADHWEYARWSATATALSWISGQVLTMLIPIFLGLRASATVAAVWNLFRPVTLVVQSSSLVILPALSSVFSEGTVSANAGRLFWRSLYLAVGAVLLYGTLMTLVSDPVLHHLYKGKYDHNTLLVGLFALSSTASAATQIFSLLIRALRNVRLLATLWSASSLLLLVIALPMLWIGSLEGAILAAVISYSVAALLAWRIVKDALSRVSLEVRLADPCVAAEARPFRR